MKVRFAREFADVGSITYTNPESLSSSSSFQSLNSTLSTKSSSGICPDSVPSSPQNNSYVNSNISGLDDLITGCATIHLNSEDEHSFSTLENSQDFSQDQTFASATDELTANDTKNLANEISLTDDFQKSVEIVENNLETHEFVDSPINTTQNIQERSLLGTVCIREPLPVAIVSNRRNSFIQIDIERSPKNNNNLNNHQANDTFNGDDEASLSQCHNTEEESNLNSTFVCLSPSKEITDVTKEEEGSSILKNNSNEDHSLPVDFVPYNIVNSVCNSTSVFAEYGEEPSLPSIPTFSSLLTNSESSKLNVSDTQEVEDNVKNSSTNNSNVTINISSHTEVTNSIQKLENKNNNLTESNSPNFSNNVVSDEQICLDNISFVESKTPEVEENLTKDICQEIENNDIVKNINLSSAKEDSFEVNDIALQKKEEGIIISDDCSDKKNVNDSNQTNVINFSIKEENQEIEEHGSSEEKLDTTIILQDVSLSLETVSEVEQYTDFKPQRQSTSLDTFNIEQPNFEELKSAAEQVANDIFQSSLECSEDNNPFVSATSEIFQDPTSFDFLTNYDNKKTINRFRTDSLYVKFDPLVADTSMLPQGNTQSINEEQNGKSENISENIDISKRNPAIAAIDRLLFYSPVSTKMTQKTNEIQEKIAIKEESVEESKSDTSLIIDINMSKELELVRTTVLQLEKELEKQKKEYEAELEKQKNENFSFQEKINKLQAQIAQEIKSKSQMTVVVEEYEKSISRLLTEKERDRTNFEQEKAKLQEELQVANVHLNNTEAAFNDVHQKYERLKGVVSTCKSNETLLKESIQENMETIKCLETRYDQLKNHAMTELEKANFELDAIRKQHEDETVKLHAMLRKAELKSNSLAELVEQKTKENKELTQILDEVIARVGHQNAE